MIYFLIPVYNEAANLSNLHKELTAWNSSEPVHYVFSDDGSKDHSIEAIKQLFGNKTLTVLGDGSNHGPGAAFNTGFVWILNNAAPDDKVVTLEADCTSDLGI